MSESKCAEYMNRMIGSDSFDHTLDIFNELHTSRSTLSFKWFVTYLKLLLIHSHGIGNSDLKLKLITTLLTFMTDHRSHWGLDNINSNEIKKLFYVVFWKICELTHDVKPIHDVPQEFKQNFLSVICTMKQTCFSDDVAKKICPHAFIASCFSTRSNTHYNADIIIEYLEKMSESFIDRYNPNYTQNVTSLKNYIKTLQDDNNASKWRYIFKLYVNLSLHRRCIASTSAKTPCTLTLQFPSQVCHIHQKKYNQLFRCMLNSTPLPIDLIHLMVKFAV